MISGDLKEKKFVIEGDLKSLRKECQIIVNELYKKCQDDFGKDRAVSYLTGMLVEILTGDIRLNEGSFEWRYSDDEKLAYSD